MPNQLIDQLLNFFIQRPIMIAFPLGFIFGRWLRKFLAKHR